MIDFSAIGRSDGTERSVENREKERTQLGQKDFLKLMTIQLSNQDPLQPMENGDFMAQMAQFSSASGIQELQEAFSGFRADMQGDQALRAASLVGRRVVAESDRGQLPEEGDLTGAVDLPVDVENLTVRISDASGQVVRRLDLGAQVAGDAEFAWDGRNADGERLPPAEYRIAAQTEIEGESASLQTLIDAEVQSVSLGRGGEPPRLDLAGMGELSLADVRQIK